MTDSALPPPDDDIDETLSLSVRKGAASKRPSTQSQTGLLKRKDSRVPPHATAPRAVAPEGTMRGVLARMRTSHLAMLGLVAVAMLAFVSIFADLLASDLPVACKVQGTTWLLPAVTHPAALEGWDNARIDAERAPGDWAIHPLVPYGPRQTAENGQMRILAPPSLRSGHLLGTDAYGRDVFARLVHGARTSMTIALLAVSAFVTIGALLGALAGFFGGVLDTLVARLVETLTAFPTLVLVLVVQAVLPHPTTLSLLAALALTRWTEVARLVRAEVLLVSSQEYVLAARALGAGPFRILFRHVAPNARAPVLVTATFGLASVVLIEAALDFLRVGLPWQVASWGEMLSQSRDHLGAWWLLAFPGLCVFLAVVALNLVGEAIRDALDPRLRAATGGLDADLPSGGRVSIAPSSTAFDGTTHA